MCINNNDDLVAHYDAISRYSSSLRSRVFGERLVMNKARSFNIAGKTAIARKATAAILIIIAVGAVAPSCAGAAPVRDAAATAMPPPAALRLARAFRAAGDLSAALDLYRQVAGAPNADSAIQVEFADSLLEAGRLDEAMGAYGRIEPGSKNRADALLGLGLARMKLGATDAALDDVNRAVAVQPDNARIRIAQGVILDSLGRHGEAQASYRIALAREPRSLAGRNDLALSLAATGQYAPAIDILAPIARSTDATPGLRQNLALIYALQGDREAARQLARADLDANAADANQRFADLARARIKAAN
jgi:Flp pilus assembly protein TadD